MKKPPKRTTIKKLKDRAWKVFSLYIRLRDCIKTTGSRLRGECITCDATLPIEDLQAGHFIPGRHNANLFSEKGVNAQCRRCNLFLGGNPLVYRRAIVEMYGDGYDEILEEEARVIKKLNTQELKDIINIYKGKVDTLMKWNA